MKKPLIGIVLDREVRGDYSDYPYFVLREHYFNAVTKAGGIPVGVDHSLSSIDEYVNVLDGLLMPGGDYDIPPAMYGDDSVHETVVTKIERVDFDWAITQKFLDNDKPILGICAGEQLLAVINGSTLIQDIDSEVEGCLGHYAVNREAVAHEVTVEPGTLLYKIIGETTMGVNSHHHQAVKHVGERVAISARSSDGVIEAIEIRDKTFCLGVQWHPEYINNPNDMAIFAAFIAACR